MQTARPDPAHTAHIDGDDSGSLLVTPSATADLLLSVTKEDPGWYTGNVEVTLHYENGTTDLEADKVVLHPLKVQLKSVAFASGKHTLWKQETDTWKNDKYGNNGNVMVGGPEWEDADLDGNPEIRDPVCYTVFSYPEMTAVLAVSPNIPASSPLDAKLRVKRVLDGRTLCTADISLTGSTLPIPSLVWAGAGCHVGTTLDYSAYELEWSYSLDSGATYKLIGNSDNQFFVVLDTPKQTSSAGHDNWLTCQRVYQTLFWATKTDDVGTIAKRVQTWIDNAGIDNSGRTEPITGQTLWALLDITGKGQCAEGAMLMDQAVRLLGIEGEYQHVLASKTTPARVYTVTDPKTPLTRPHCGVDEELFLFFTAAPGNHFRGFNYGEGCCLVDHKLYSAFAGGDVGETGGVVGNKTAQDAAHHILLQLADRHPDLQRWLFARPDVPCGDGDTVPVP